MFARLARYDVSVEQVDEAVQAFSEAAARLAELNGSQGGYLLVDRESGGMLTFTFWDSEAACSQSEVRAAALRRQALSTVGGEVVSVSSYEVAVDFTPQPAAQSA